MELILADNHDDSVPSSGEIARSVPYYVYDPVSDPTPDDVIDFLSDTIPRINANLRLSSFTSKRLAKGLYEISAEYGPAQKISGVTPLEGTTGEDSYAFQFSTAGGSYHIKSAKEQTGYGTSPPAIAGNAINWNGQAAEGIDVVGGKLQFDIRKKKPGNLITLNYLRVLYALTGKTNNATYLGFAAGELLFLGANGQQVRGGDTEITFTFLANPNLASATIAGVTVSDIKGHDYVWPYLIPNATVPVVLGVYKARIYDSGNFSLLGAT
jgi:hypothetical protein